MSGIDVTTDGSVMTARLVGPSIEERQARRFGIYECRFAGYELVVPD